MNSLVETIRDSYFRIGCPKSILVAYSAGADSLALLLGLMTVKNELPIEIVCAHVNHGLRASACADEKLAIDITRRLDIALMVKRVEVSREGNLEAAAREARYTALKQAMRESGAQVIALAHHADDQAETMMMNLARGSGLDGLAGMNEFRPPYWRPLLSIPKSVLIDALKGAALGPSSRFDGYGWLGRKAGFDFLLDRFGTVSEGGRRTRPLSWVRLPRKDKAGVCDPSRWTAGTKA